MPKISWLTETVHIRAAAVLFVLSISFGNFASITSGDGPDWPVRIILALQGAFAVGAFYAIPFLKRINVMKQLPPRGVQRRIAEWVQQRPWIAESYLILLRFAMLAFWEAALLILLISRIPTFAKYSESAWKCLFLPLFIAVWAIHFALQWVVRVCVVEG